MPRYAIPPQWAADPGGGLFVVPLAGLGWRFPLAVVLGYPRRRGSLGAAAADHKKKNPGAVNAPGLAGYSLRNFKQLKQDSNGENQHTEQCHIITPSRLKRCRGFPVFHEIPLENALTVPLII